MSINGYRGDGSINNTIAFGKIINYFGCDYAHHGVA